MDPYNGYTTEAEMYSTLFLILGFTFAVTAAAVALSWILIAIPLSALFRKTGIEPWKAWVPFYSTYTWLRLGGQNGHWVWLSLIPYGSAVTSVFLYIGMYRTGKAFGKEAGFLVLGIFLPWVWLFILGFGKDEYRPELIAAAGLPAPLEGYGARGPADGLAVPQYYGATPYPGSPYPAPSDPTGSHPAPTYPAPTYPVPPQQTQPPR